MSVGLDTITKVSLKSDPEYLPRVRRIMACLADSVGMDQQETQDAALALSEVCTNAIRHGSPHGSDDQVFITLMASNGTLTADVTDCGASSNISVESSKDSSGLGIRLVQMLTDSVQFISHTTGNTVRLIKKAKAYGELS